MADHGTEESLQFHIAKPYTYGALYNTGRTPIEYNIR